ncbi:MAG: DUF805 domain-containing protein [Neisseriaceae bacterium]
MANFFTQHYIDTVKHHSFDYKGRAPARKFGFYVLSQFLILIAFILIAAVSMRLFTPLLIEKIGLAILLLWSLITLPATLCLTIRRLHDVGLSGWFVLLIISIGPILALLGLKSASNGVGFGIIGALCVIKSQPKGNRYGPAPTL